MKNFLLPAFVVFLFACSAFAQKTVIVPAEPPQQSTMVKTAKGVLVFWNEPGNNFTFEIKGRKIGPLPGGQLRFQVDGQYLEIKTLEKAAFLKEINKSGLTDKELLDAYRQWETDYIGQTLGAKLNVETA